MLSPRTVDYLETIYLLSLENDTVGVTQVAASRSVTIPTARVAVARLKDEGCVRQERYGKILLTDKGRERARTVYRSHTVLFRFLHEILGVETDRADDEACRLEHGLSQDTLARLIRFLNDGAGGNRAKAGGAETGDPGTGGE